MKTDVCFMGRQNWTLPSEVFGVGDVATLVSQACRVLHSLPLFSIGLGFVWGVLLAPSLQGTIQVSTRRVTGAAVG